jgi:tellurite resistance protein TerC
MKLGLFPLWGWLTFSAVTAALLAFDLFSHRDVKEQTRKRALAWSIIWVGAGLLFSIFVWIAFSSQAAQEYLAAYLIEQSLSLDNLFLFLLIFRTLNIPAENQHRVLFWGIFGALVFRGIFIFFGVRALERWEWVSYIFGALLLYAAIKAWRDDLSREQDSRLTAWLQKHLPITGEQWDGRFIANKDGQRAATPLLVALIGIELSDIMFAVDSVPAAFSVSRAPFIIYSSNIFAILGLRALFGVLAQSLAGFKYLHYGLAGVLGFASVKMVVDRWIHIPPLVSVGMIAAMIGAAIWASLHRGGEREE